MEPDPQDQVELQDSPVPEGEHLVDVGMEMERQKLLEEKKRLEANLAQVLWEDGQEPSEDDVLSWKMRLREIELELDGKSAITREDKCICLEVVDAVAKVADFRWRKGNLVPAPQNESCHIVVDHKPCGSTHHS